MPFKIFSKKII